MLFRLELYGLFTLHLLCGQLLVQEIPGHVGTKPLCQFDQTPRVWCTRPHTLYNNHTNAGTHILTVHTCTCVVAMQYIHVHVNVSQLHVHIESVRISSSAQESDVLSSTARGSLRLCWRSPARWRTWRWTGPLAMSTGPPTHSTPTTTSRWPIEIAGFVRPWFEGWANLGDSFCIR